MDMKAFGWGNKELSLEYHRKNGSTSHLLHKQTPAWHHLCISKTNTFSTVPDMNWEQMENDAKSMGTQKWPRVLRAEPWCIVESDLKQ